MLRKFSRVGLCLVLLFAGSMTVPIASQSAEVSDDTSWFTIDKPTIPADGKSRCKVTIFLRDKDCNPLKGKAVIIKSSRDSLDNISQSGPSDGKGECVGFISSATPGAVNIGIICEERTIIRENMIPNGSVEEGGKDIPEGWSKWSSSPSLCEFSWVEGIVHSGRKSLKIVSLDENIDCWWLPKVFSKNSLLFDRDYILTAWAKIENIEPSRPDLGACVHIGQKSEEDSYIEGTSSYSSWIKGTGDWQKMELKFKLHPQAYNLELYAGILHAAGIVWLDDMRLEITPTIVFK